MQVPYLDLKAHHEPLKDELNAAIQEVIAVNAFAGGPFVEKFERDFAVFCECQHAVGVGNGTDALWLALLALGVGPGVIEGSPNRGIAVELIADATTSGPASLDRG